MVSDDPFADFDFPALEEIKVEDTIGLNIESLPQMLQRSQGSLLNFSYHALYFRTPRSSCVRDLLISLSSAERVNIATLGVLDSSLLREIGHGDILPCLRYIECLTDSTEDILDMLQTQVTRRQTHDNRVASLTFELWARVRSLEAETRLKTLCSMHDYDYRITLKPLLYNYNSYNSPDISYHIAITDH
ncbi:hypothetical protein H0H93_000941 [Arthromyces matolae]|nr:hypothetical protein H0H93_000941 [Arthromyces matolae]